MRPLDVASNCLELVFGALLEAGGLALTLQNDASHLPFLSVYAGCGPCHFDMADMQRPRNELAVANA